MDFKPLPFCGTLPFMEPERKKRLAIVFVIFALLMTGYWMTLQHCHGDVLERALQGEERGSDD